MIAAVLTNSRVVGLLIPVGIAWILGRTRHPPDCKPNGNRLGCYCLCSSKNYGWGDWDRDSDIDKIMQTRADCKCAKNINTDVFKVTDTSLKIWMKVMHVLQRSGCVKKILSDLTNLLYPEKEWCLTVGTGSLWWDSEEDMLTQFYSRAMVERVGWQPGWFCSGMQFASPAGT